MPLDDEEGVPFTLILLAHEPDTGTGEAHERRRVAVHLTPMAFAPLLANRPDKELGRMALEAVRDSYKNNPDVRALRIVGVLARGRLETDTPEQKRASILRVLEHYDELLLAATQDHIVNLAEWK